MEAPGFRDMLLRDSSGWTLLFLVLLFAAPYPYYKLQARTTSNRIFSPRNLHAQTSSHWFGNFWDVNLYLRPCRLHAFSALWWTPCLRPVHLNLSLPVLGAGYRLELPRANPRLKPLRVFRDRATRSWLDVVSSPVECRNSGFRRITRWAIFRFSATWPKLLSNNDLVTV